MPTDFLKDRYREFLHETSGTETVEFISFDKSSVDPVTGDVDESLAYSNNSIKIPARIHYYPTKAMRALAGLDIAFESVIKIATVDLNNKNIQLKIGDAFILPDSLDKRYVVKVVNRKQIETDFIETLVFISRNVKNRG